MKNFTTLFLILAICSSTYSKSNLKASTKGDCIEGEWTLCAASEKKCHWSEKYRMMLRCGNGDPNGWIYTQTIANDSNCPCGYGGFCWYKKATYAVPNPNWKVNAELKAGDNNELRLVSENQNYALVFFGSGKLMIKDVLGSYIWQTNNVPSASHDCHAVLQADGNLVIYQGATAIWATYSTPSASKAVLSNKGHLEIHDTTDKIIWSSESSDGKAI